jgi:hypothetical protein
MPSNGEMIFIFDSRACASLSRRFLGTRTDEFLARQVFAALQVRQRQVVLRPVLRHLGFIERRIQTDQQLPLLHHLPVAEADRGDAPGDFRPQHDAFVRAQRPDGLQVLLHCAWLDDDDFDRRRPAGPTGAAFRSRGRSRALRLALHAGDGGPARIPVRQEVGDRGDGEQHADRHPCDSLIFHREFCNGVRNAKPGI